MARFLSVLLIAFICSVSAKTFFKESFSGDWESRWVKGNSKGDDAGNLVTTEGGVKTETDAKFYQYAASFDEFNNLGKDLVFQFSVRHGQSIDCGGGYFKLLPKSSTEDLVGFNGDTPYLIMFGPDICGSTKRTHAIITYKDENHLINEDLSCKKDKWTHVYTLILNSDDQTFTVLIDNKEERSGSITDNWEVLEPKEIDDPNASKPEDWVDTERIADPEDVKPEGYDDIPAEIPDPDAEQPEDWDTDLDGEWSAPMIDNPDYKGEWKPKMIDNPDYKGPWEHPQVPNPDFKEDDSIIKFESIAGVGLEIWQVKAGTTFGNMLITDDKDLAEKAAEKIIALQEQEKDEDKKEKERQKKEEEANKADEEDDDEDENDSDLGEDEFGDKDEL